MCFCLSVCLFVCVSLLNIWAIFIMDFYFPPHVCFSICYQKIFEVCGSISGRLMRRSLGVFISIELNIFKVRISFLKGSNGKLLQREI